jgi:hypothetical protein
MGRERLGAVPLAELEPTRLALHWAAQLPAAVGHSLLGARDDFSQSSLRVAPALGAFVGEPFGLPGARSGARAASLLIRPFALEVELARFPLKGRILGEALDWLGRAAAPELAAASRAALELPGFELPEHPVAAGAAFEEPDPRALEELARWFTFAALELEPVAAEYDCGPVRCWPHHFDTAVLMSIPGGASDDPEDARTIGVGMSPGDDSYAEPYWYVNPWPPPPADRLPAFGGPGAWHSADWTGVVLTGAELVAAGDLQEQTKALRAYLGAAISVARRTLSEP